MAHYDCTNCGYSMGIDFGSCENCTPKEYFDLWNKWRSILYDADRAWEEHISAERNLFIAEFKEKNGIDAIQERMRKIEEDARK